MDTEFSNGQMEPNMKVNGRITGHMEKGPYIMQMEIIIQESLVMIKLMGMVDIIDQMDGIMKVIGRMINKMV